MAVLPPLLSFNVESALKPAGKTAVFDIDYILGSALKSSATWTVMPSCTCPSCLLKSDAPPLSFELFPQTVAIDITAKDIAAGTPRNADDCAISRAVKRRFDGADVATASGVVRVTVDGRDAVYRPADLEAAGDFVSHFDGAYGRDRDVAPTQLVFYRVA